MKKLTVSLFVVLAMLLTPFVASAEEVKSPTREPITVDSVVSTDAELQKEIEDGTVKLVITPDGSAMNAEAQAEMDEAAPKLEDASVISELKNAAGFGDKDVVVSEIFDISLIRNNTDLVDTSAEISVTFTPANAVKDGEFFVVHYADGSWGVVSSKLNADGSITVTCKNGLSPFAILVVKGSSSAAGETTNESNVGTAFNSNFAIYAAAGLAALAGAAMVVKAKKDAE